ncbi:hypothetical protein [Niabella sp.]|uniref:hypothetical protein n=1 Tax=Niabella sp. TaxID=1962976 RepID=UPI002633AE78|nr:hypothetical protein [Niabella sp.]
MRNILFTIGCSFLLLMANAQQASVRSLAKIEAGPGGIGFGYEAKLAATFTLDANIGVGGNYEIKDHSFSYVFASSKYETPALYLNINPRFYYNIAKRASRDRNTSLNGANYFGVKVKLVAPFDTDYYTGTSLINVHWGIQRNIGGKWLINTHAGLGYAVSQVQTSTIYYNSNGSNTVIRHPSPSSFYPAIDIKFAYVLSKKDGKKREQW